MMRLLVIGNSHAGALKLGWDSMAGQARGIEAAFFVAPGEIYRNMRLDRVAGRFGVLDESRFSADQFDLVRRLNGGRMTADLQAADHVLMAGLGFQPMTLVGALMRSDVEGLRETGNPALLSRPAFEALLDDIARRYLPGPDWHGWTRPRLWIVDRPRPAESRLTETKRFAPLVENPSGLPEALALSSARNRDALEAVGIGYIGQPDSTFAPTGMTRAEFSRGSQRLDPGTAHPDSDDVHMNADYGALQWQEILAVLRAQK